MTMTSGTKWRVDQRSPVDRNPRTWVRVKPAQAKRCKKHIGYTYFRVNYVADCGEVIIRYRERDHRAVMDAIIDTEQDIKIRWTARKERRDRAAMMATLNPEQRKLVLSLLPS
jgi:hypothetical protein